MKYAVGTKWIMTTDTGEKFLGEVLHIDDSRIDKIKCSEDVCLWFPKIQWGTTYDSDFCDEHCIEAPQEEKV
jgi:hypothetical protein